MESSRKVSEKYMIPSDYSFKDTLIIEREEARKIEEVLQRIVDLGDEQAHNKGAAEYLAGRLSPKGGKKADPSLQTTERQKFLDSQHTYACLLLNGYKEDTDIPFLESSQAKKLLWSAARQGHIPSIKTLIKCFLTKQLPEEPGEMEQLTCVLSEEDIQKITSEIVFIRPLQASCLAKPEEVPCLKFPK